MAAIETHDSVAAMAAAYADKAVQEAHKFTAELDYSENSLMELETILDRLAGEISATQSSPSELSEICKTWGSYFGEVVRQRFGGEWSIESYPGKSFATLTLNINGNKIFPSMKVHRRLAQGASENVWSFYKMIKMKLEAKPRGRVQ
jgi:hypothetical protein